MIGKIIVENEQNGNIRAEYGKDIRWAICRRRRTKSMLADNMDIDIIAKYTGLSEQEIEELK